VKTFLDEIPRVPKSAFRDLKEAKLRDAGHPLGPELQHRFQAPTVLATTASTPTIAPLFNQPSCSSGFFSALKDGKVCLESAHMFDPKTIKGSVRVVNLDFNKQGSILRNSISAKTISINFPSSNFGQISSKIQSMKFQLRILDNKYPWILRFSKAFLGHMYTIANLNLTKVRFHEIDSRWLFVTLLTTGGRPRMWRPSTQAHPTTASLIR
jgi:hypothetical protein